MFERQLVEFVGQASVEIPEALQEQLRPELEAIFRPKRPASSATDSGRGSGCLPVRQDEQPEAEEPRAITVSRSYAGYRGASFKKIVLGVEVRFPSAFETHIVKIGSVEEVKRDYEGWQECLRGRNFASRIFLPVRRFDLPEGRLAVLYRDGYTLFGPDAKRSSPESLETVAGWSACDDKPTPSSVERSISHIYTDLGRWLYYGAQENSALALDFYKQRLAKSLVNWAEQTAVPGQREQAKVRWRLRQEAIWLTCGSDRPDGSNPARYLDPYDYVIWALESGVLPATLVGRGHGDLHGRNVLLGVQRGEAEYPAVFDYGEMGCKNVLVWDFVKLETELKVRLLPIVYRDSSARELLLRNSARIRKTPRHDEEADVIDDQAKRADRLDCAFAFETLLAERTGWIQGRAEAEARQPPGGRDITGCTKIDRLLSIVLRIRQEAALWLGYEFNRHDAWMDEYYFGLAVYGLVHARPNWHYEPRQGECSLVSAGVAAAQMQSAQAVIRDMMNREHDESAKFPSYRVPLAIIHRHWKAGRVDSALKILNDVLPPVEPAEPKRASFHQAVPLVAEHALLLAEKGQYQQAEEILRPLRESCRVFGDHETLCRIGRAYKESGDDKWNKNPVPFSRLENLPARQMYRHALAAYREAFEIRLHYYPGVNAASLAWLVGEIDLARLIAKQVRNLCEEMQKGMVGEEAVWVYASEGETALLLAEDSAATFYGSALDDLRLGDWWMAQSMYDQLCRLWHAMGPVAVNPVIGEFETREIWSLIKPGPLGDCGGRKGTTKS